MGAQRILLVEDEPIGRKVIADTLMQAGYQVTVCSDGKQAIELITANKANSFGLIILDRVMPVLDGLAFLQWRNEKGYLADVPVIMLTAVKETEAIVDALEAGAQEYLTKPVDPEQLIHLVKEMIH